MYAWVEDILDMLELSGVADELVGSPDVGHGLSMANRKALSIGVELAANTSILFLDEPTTGLTSQAALQVVRVIRRIASTGRSVICTIHQPSATIFYEFDDLLLLKRGGEMCYFGELGFRARASRNFLEDVPGTDPCPHRVNPADWMLTVIGSGTTTAAAARADRVSKVYAVSDLCKRNQTQADRLSTHEADGNQDGIKALAQQRYAVTHQTQMVWVLWRAWVSNYRNTHYVPLRFRVLFIQSIILGLSLLQLGATSRALVQSRISAIYEAGIFIGIIHLNASLAVYAREKPVYYRERASNTYSSFAYSTAQTITELPWLVLGIALYFAIFYPLVGLSGRFDLAIFLVFAESLFVIFMLVLGQALIAAFPSAQAAQVT